MNSPFVNVKRFLSFNALVLTSLECGKIIQGTCNLYKVGGGINMYFHQTSNVLEHKN